MSEEGDSDKRQSVTSDFSPRSTQRGTTPPPPRTPTPVAAPTVREIALGTPVPISLERFVQKILMATVPLGNPEKYVRDLILEAVISRLQKMVATPAAFTRTQQLVASNLLKILSEED